MKGKVGLFFGSFNPVHIGHLIIANYMACNTDLNHVWMVVSPHNPHKNKASLANDYDRLRLVELATEDNDFIFPSDIEFNLPKPSYTIDTLTFLKEKYPSRTFALIMGGDNLSNLHKWKNYELILENYEIYVYDRPGYDKGQFEAPHPHIHYFKTPQLDISASYIRACIAEKKDFRYMVHHKVYDELLHSSMYKNITQ